MVKIECQDHIQIWGLGNNFGGDSPFITLCLGKSRCNRDSGKSGVFMIFIIGELESNSCKQEFM